MRILVTGSAGHLGEALMRTLSGSPHEATGLDIRNSDWTTAVGSIAARGFVRDAMRGVDAVLHTATLHKPHVATHARQDFIDTNVSGTLNLLEEAVEAGVGAFVFTSTTSAFGRALVPRDGAPAAWITEDVMPLPKNIYGATKLAAEHLCEMFHHKTRMPCIVLRTSRFFPEDDDDRGARERFDADNLKVNELLFRRADIADIVGAHLAALDRAQAIGFDRFIVSATTPFAREDAAILRVDPASIVRRAAPQYEREYARRGWRLSPIDRVYDNARARETLGWTPRHDFASAIEALAAGRDFRSALARAIGAKGYHGESFRDGRYPVE